MDGSRCYYSPDVKVTWDDAWKICAGNGSVLAQVHTDSELETISRMLTVYMNLMQNFALTINNLFFRKNTTRKIGRIRFGWPRDEALI